MKKRIFIMIVAFILILCSCSNFSSDNKDAPDSIAPGPITNIKAIAGDSRVTLTWTDPNDEDLDGIHISYSETGSSGRAALSSGFLIPKGDQTVVISGLNNETCYSFSLQARDVNQNESNVVTVSATPTAIVVEFVTVVFEQNNGNDPTIVTVEKNSSVGVTISDPLKDGYVFDGWYDSSDYTTKVDLSTKTFSSNIILYAKYVEDIRYTVTFETNGGSSIDSQSILNGCLASEPKAPVKLGYVFCGWYSTSELINKYDFNSTISTNITLYAKWTEDKTVYILSVAVLQATFDTLDSSMEPYTIIITDEAPNLDTICNVINANQIDVKLNLEKCTSLTTLENSFRGNAYIVALYLPPSVTTIGSLYETSNLSYISGPGVLKIENRDLMRCYKLETVDFPVITEIEEYGLAYCYALKEFSFPENFTTIGEEAFRYCKSLESITIPATTSLSTGSAFRQCYNLKTVTLLTDEDVIGGWSFAQTAIESLRFPHKATTIEAGTCEGCSSLKTVYIPKTVTAIEGNAFSSSQLTKIYYEGSKYDWANISIDSSNNSAFSNATFIYNYSYD